MYIMDLYNIFFTTFSDNFRKIDKCNRNNIVQLEWKYIKYLIKYGHLYELFFTCAYVNDKKISLFMI